MLLSPNSTDPWPQLHKSWKIPVKDTTCELIGESGKEKKEILYFQPYFDILVLGYLFLPPLPM